jgi:hypothetical protein
MGSNEEEGGGGCIWFISGCATLAETLVPWQAEEKREERRVRGGRGETDTGLLAGVGPLHHLITGPFEFQFNFGGCFVCRSGRPGRDRGIQAPASVEASEAV